MNKKLVVIAVLVIGLLVVSVGAIYAQSGNGNGRGRNGDGDNTCQENCTGTAQQNQNGQQQNGNGNQNGNMNMNCQQDCTGDMQHHQYGSHHNMGNGSAYQYQTGGWMTMLPAKTDLPLTEAVIEAMIDGYTDEFNAYSAYTAIIEQFGELRPVSAIANAEAQHMDAWTFLFERYGVALPELTAPEIPTFATYEEAVTFARDAEIANIGLYDTMLATLADYPDMVQVVTNLKDASLNNHLPAFENYLK
ncbi:MAG: hypothetical protein MUE54_02340 [Anaerolineae bacterium]|jgi:hypothetical protein|nr:hypothetical protein [Anaerolineae bacterium]